MHTRIRAPAVSAGLAALALCVASSAAAQEVRPAGEGRHEVDRGDTLWDLAARFLADPFLWPEIFRLNPDVVEDPDLIYPGETLRIPGPVTARPDGAAVAGRRRGARTTASARPASGDLSGTVFANRGEGLSGASHLSLAEPPPSALISESDHYRVGLLLDPGELGASGVTTRVVEESVLDLELARTIRLNQEVVVATGELDPAVGDRLRAVRWGRDLADHRVLSSLALLEVIRDDGADSVRARVIALYGRYEVGDVVIATEPFRMDPAARAEATEDDLTGRIVGFETEQPILDLDDPVFLDLGRRDGVRTGDEFLAFSSAQGLASAADPRDALSRLRVVRTTEGTSTAIVVSIRDPATAAGAPVRRVARLPG